MGFRTDTNYATGNSTIHVQVGQQSHRLRMSITNRADGVSKQLAEHAFEPFWRGDEARTAIKNKTGLGLSLCKKLMGIVGGSIELSVLDANTVRVDLEIVDQSHHG